MTSAPVFSKGRDLDATAVVLRRWLAERLADDGVEVGGLTYPTGAGVSNETILFDARLSSGEHRGLVLRVAPAPEYQMFFQPRFRMQFDLLATLRRLGTVRVPEVQWFEDDDGVIGAPFFVMERLRGRVPVSMPVYTSQGWVLDATPDERRTLWLSAMRQLAAIHLVPVDEVAFVGELERGPTGLDQQLVYWWSFAEWLFGDVPEFFHTLFAWLRANQPVEPMGLSWGDARIGNMMFGDDYEVVGVMDWEQASLGGGLDDLGWWLFFDDMHSVEQGLARPAGLGTRQETIELYEELTGRAVANLEWHEAFAGIKTALLALRSRQVLNVGSAEQATRNPYLPTVCRIIGLPLPPEWA